MRRAIILSLEAALALAVLLAGVGLAGAERENAFHKNAALALANDALDAVVRDPLLEGRLGEAFRGTPYCYSREAACAANCVEAARTRYDGSFHESRLLVCWD